MRAGNFLWWNINCFHVSLGLNHLMIFWSDKRIKLASYSFRRKSTLGASEWFVRGLREIKTSLYRWVEMEMPVWSIDLSESPFLRPRPLFFRHDKEKYFRLIRSWVNRKGLRGLGEDFCYLSDFGSVFRRLSYADWCCLWCFDFAWTWVDFDKFCWIFNTFRKSKNFNWILKKNSIYVLIPN